MGKVYANAFASDPEVKKKLTEEILTVDFPTFCKRMNARLEKNGKNNFIAGNSITIADVALSMISKDWHNTANPHSAKLLEIVAANPALKAYTDYHIENTFKEYFASRPETAL